MLEPRANGRGRKSAQIRELQSTARRQRLRPTGTYRLTETPNGTTIVPHVKRATARAGNNPETKNVAYWA